MRQLLLLREMALGLEKFFILLRGNMLYIRGHIEYG